MAIVKEELLEFINTCELRFRCIAEVREDDWYSDCYVTGFDLDGVTFEGEETWDFGGHERHFHSVSWDYFQCDEREFEHMLECLRVQLKSEKDRKEMEWILLDRGGKIWRVTHNQKVAKLTEMKERELYENLKQKFEAN